MTTGSAGTEDAKHVLDSIGEKVYKGKVKNDAKTYKGELEGNLSFAPTKWQTVGTDDPCVLIKEKHDEFINSNRYPCANRSKIRFSDESRSQCTHNRIKDSQEGDNKGACAPFRRLSVCDYNLEKMGTKKNKARHKLLLDVCLAAYYEAESLINYRAQYDAEHHDTGFTTCTMLARSFADIGDIIRGKDLYLGNPQESAQREKLEKNLKTIFTQIYNDVTSGRTNGKKEVLKARYQNDTTDYFQLREDWWNANRSTVWKAMTCSAEGYQYFRPTCGGNEKNSTLAKDKCRCSDKPKTIKGSGDGDVNIVPTYFDYVPQYLRWFEEWAEDFCRKRKHKLENAIKNCRGDKNDKYCSRNGYDCTQTIRGENKLVKSEDCTKCSVLCTPFVKWIDNKQKEFEKQEKKYADEIEKYKNGTTTIKTANGPINNLYVKEFYEKLKSGYKDVNAFLELLNKETTCKDPPTVGNEKASKVDFTNDKIDDIFSHTEYCETCPWCATKKKQNEKWEEQNYESGCTKNVITTHDDKKTTDIELLDKNTSGTNIVEKLGGLCNDNSNKTIQTWKCHFESFKNDNCVLQDGNKNTPHRTIMPYDVLFPNWINEMLKDSIDWSKELDSCINNAKSQNCKNNKCNRECGCFQKWVKRMKEEWKQLEEHYEKEDFGEGIDPYVILEGNLYLSYFPKIKDAYPKEKRVEEMKKIIEENSNNIKATRDNNSINTFLGQEEQEAEKCKQKQNECPKKLPKTKPPAAAPGDVGRSADPSPATVPHAEKDESDGDQDEDDEDEDDDSGHDGGGGAKEGEAVVDRGEVKEHTETQPPPAAATTPTVDVCAIVKTALEGNLSEACRQKYEKGKERFTQWYCASKSDATAGGLCIPPRRRRLYVGELTKWAEKQNTNKSQVDGTTGQSQNGESSGQAQTQDGTPSQPGKTASQPDPLLKAFVESAAVETFFLWDRYKKLNAKSKASTLGVGGGLGLAALNGALTLGLEDDDKNKNKDPQTELNDGTIPDGFLRQMFYTLGDYRDICVGNVPSGIDTVSASDKTKDEVSDKVTMDEIQNKIQQHINSVNQSRDNPNLSGSTHTQPNSVKSHPNSGKTPQQTLWDKIAPQIWNGMICALTYDITSESGEKGKASITQDPNLKSVLWDSGKNEPKKSEYKYDQVKLDENSGTGDPKGNQAPSPTSQTTLLSNFVKRPPYFRYLEEWGETFCKERKKRLAQIKKDCKVEDDDNKCSGDGEQCDRRYTSNGVSADLEGRSCGNSCRSYKKWIKRKKDEFTKQQQKYTNAIKDPKNKSGDTYDNKFIKTLEENYSSADSFLNNLKGPCKNNNDNGEEHKIDFNDTKKTFGHETYCDPCSAFTVKCENSNCGGDTKVKCKSKNSITAANFDTMVKSTKEVVMRVSDNNTNGNKFADLQDCTDANIFKGIRKDVWKCRNVCGVHICKREKEGDVKNNDQIILIRALIERWLEYFLQDYNKIKTTLIPCMKNGQGSTCIKDYDKKHTCVEQWIEKKKTEWEKIKEHYLEKNENIDDGMTSLVRNFLEELQHLTEFKNAIKPCKSLNDFENSCGLNDAEKSKTKDGDKRDLVLCMIKKLETKIKTCEEKHPQTGDQNQTQTCQESPLEPDEEDLLLEEEENTVGKQQPSFCPKVDTPSQQEETDDKCDSAPTEPSAEKPAGPSPGDGNPNEQTPILKPEEEAPAPEQTPALKPEEEAPAPEASEPNKEETPSPSPPLSDQPTNSISDILSSTIPFGIAIALTSIAFLFLK
ncbi:hypothetical protein PFTANZ_06119, partial [Plasmodium falciparum Tanzania (2000708)]